MKSLAEQQQSQDYQKGFSNSQNKVGQEQGTVQRSVEETQWSGAATLERSSSNSSSQKPEPSYSIPKAATLIGGEVLMLCVFAALGRSQHGEEIVSIDTIVTALPFLTGYIACAAVLGGYSNNAVNPYGPWSSLKYSLKSWAIGIPIGHVIRAIQRGYLPETSFFIVSMIATLIFTGSYRTLYGALFKVARAQKSGGVAQANRKAGMTEIFDLLKSLIGRW